MEHSDIHNRTIAELVSENYVFASILYYFGIRFFEFSDSTLEEVCRKNNIESRRVVEELNRSYEEGKTIPVVSRYPLDLLIEYLKHSHHLFARKKLPYLANLIRDLDLEDTSYQNIAEDLKIVFPLFVEDFIHHMYLEEDTFFSYALQLHKADTGKINKLRVFYLLEKKSVADFAAEHEADDDTMDGIRIITRGYYTDNETPLHLKVIYDELKSFEKELDNHAGIENNILFPKALAIENSIKQYFEKNRHLN